MGALSRSGVLYMRPAGQMHLCGPLTSQKTNKIKNLDKIELILIAFCVNCGQQDNKLKKCGPQSIFLLKFGPRINFSLKPPVLKAHSIHPYFYSVPNNQLERKPAFKL
jgi:hypothetical protein